MNYSPFRRQKPDHFGSVAIRCLDDVAAVTPKYTSLFCAHARHYTPQTEQLTDAVKAAAGQGLDVLLNLQHVEELNSNGAGLIVQLMEVATDAGQRLVCANYHREAQQNVAQILELLGIAGMTSVYGDAKLEGAADAVLKRE